jgi:CHRD domain
MEAIFRTVVILSTVLAAISVRVAHAERIQATLTGFQEVPSVSTAASGEFRGFINRDEQSIDFELRYSGLQGVVLQGHIHIAQLSVNGSIVIWLCQTATNLDPTGFAGQCEAGQGTEAVITGTITAANVIAGSQAPQQLEANDLAAVIRAIRAGSAYVNVHTDLSPGGEIRGQIRSARRR